MKEKRNIHRQIKQYRVNAIKSDAKAQKNEKECRRRKQ